MSMEHDQEATNLAATSAKLREAIRKAHSTPQPVLPALLLRKGDVPGHEFHGNQYGAAGKAAAEATRAANAASRKAEDTEDRLSASHKDSRAAHRAAGAAHDKAAEAHAAAYRAAPKEATGKHYESRSDHLDSAARHRAYGEERGPTGMATEAQRSRFKSRKSEPVTLLTKARDANTPEGQEAMRKALRQAMTKPAFAPLHIKHSAFAKDADT